MSKRAILRKLFQRWVPEGPPKPTALDLWRAARIEYLKARDRHDARSMGVAAKKLTALARAALAEPSA